MTAKTRKNTISCFSNGAWCVRYGSSVVMKNYTMAEAICLAVKNYTMTEAVCLVAKMWMAVDLGWSAAKNYTMAEMEYTLVRVEKGCGYLLQIGVENLIFCIYALIR
ncbi:hypothetical protein [Candidatus Electronema sp. JM]|uniref:hypothetical protein n=1 Tax=Candidatus Electronema sp. JM TaxID=3401571 RepID=UPI003AA964B0